MFHIQGWMVKIRVLIHNLWPCKSKWDAVGTKEAGSIMWRDWEGTALDTGSCLRLTEKVALHIGYENLHLKLFYIFNECIYRAGLPPIQGIAHTEIKMLLIFTRPHVTRHEVNTRDVCRVFALSHESSFTCFFPFSCSRFEIDVYIQVWHIKTSVNEIWRIGQENFQLLSIYILFFPHMSGLLNKSSLKYWVCLFVFNRNVK